jgi:diguanylate cyclase (GGDEF)-like protein
MVALELEKITFAVRKNLSKHRNSMKEFKERVNKLNELHQDPAWKELCEEADEILKPTLQLAAQIANAYAEIRQQGTNLSVMSDIRADRLTGVANRRGLNEILDSQFALYIRYHTPFCIGVFDIDHFTRVNDEQGRLVGDRLLKDFAKLLDESVRETDCLARYGSDKFAVIMPHTDSIGAGVVCERIRVKAEEQLEITISGGIASCESDDTQESLLSRGDKALAHAKTAGRNRIIFCNGNLMEPVEPEPDFETV